MITINIKCCRQCLMFTIMSNIIAFQNVKSVKLSFNKHVFYSSISFKILVDIGK